MKKILHFIVYTNLFIAAAVGLFTLQTGLLFKIDEDLLSALVTLNFLSTFMLYNLQRLYLSTKDLSGKYAWYQQHRRLLFTLLVLAVLSATELVWDFFMRHRAMFVSYALLAAFSLLYFLPPLKLRRHGLLKPFFIALVFVYVGIKLPVQDMMSVNLCFYMAGQLCFVAALCLLFDIKDVVQDKEAGITTWPVKYSITKSKYLSAFLLLSYLVAMLCMQHMALSLTAIVIAGLGVLLTAFAKPSRPFYFYYVLVDGLIIVQYLVLQLFINSH